ncbi:MAG: hypothetical protein ACYTF9_06650 [Planctomycetota bacterium]|jgi:hypothetical protein
MNKTTTASTRRLACLAWITAAGCLALAPACSPVEQGPPSRRGILGEYENPRSNETFGHDLNPGQSTNPGR